MPELEKKLKIWVSHGFINQHQAEQIYEFESTQSNRSWILSSLLSLGIIVIGIGVISLIAANWQQISNTIKLVFDFVILISLSILILRAAILKKEIQFEILLLFFVILNLASIGLISQIYNTGGALYQALMLWALITFPVVTTARYLMTPLIWTIAFLTSLIYTAYESPFFYSIFVYNIQAILITIPLLCACLAMYSERFNLLEHAFVRAFQICLFISGLIAIGVTEHSPDFPISKIFIYNQYIPAYILFVLTYIGIFKNTTYNNTQKYLLIFALLTFFISFNLPLLIAIPSIIYALLTVFILGLIAVFFASLKNRRLFQLMLFLIGLRFLELYFQALGGLLLTGIGLIFSGILIIIMTVLWSKYRLAIAIWVERWIQ